MADLTGIENMLLSAFSGNEIGAVNQLLGAVGIGKTGTGKHKTVAQRVKKACDRKAAYALRTGSVKRAVHWLHYKRTI